MDRGEVIKWLMIMKANLNTFPEVSSEKKIEALAEAVRLLKNEQSEEPSGSEKPNKSEKPTGSDDCVSRAEVLKIYNEWFATCNIADKKESPKAKIEALPPVTSIRPKGHWIEHPHEWGDNWQYSQYECSCCHNWAHFDTDYCPNCGVEMREVEE